MTPAEIKQAAQIIEFLEHEIQNVPFNIKRGEHIKVIDDEICFSVVGYNSSETERQLYLDWERTRFSLRSIASKLKNTFYHWDIDVLEDELVILPKKALDKPKQ